jgi:hypothetical protein
MGVKECTTTKLSIGIQHKYDSQKSNKRSMVKPSLGRQKGKVKKRPKDEQFARTKKGRELDPLVVGSYLTHGPSNVTSMQIVRFHSNGRSRTSITRQRDFLSITKVKAH